MQRLLKYQELHTVWSLWVEEIQQCMDQFLLNFLVSQWKKKPKQNIKSSWEQRERQRQRGRAFKFLASFWCSPCHERPRQIKQGGQTEIVSLVRGRAVPMLHMMWQVLGRGSCPPPFQPAWLQMLASQIPKETCCQRPNSVFKWNKWQVGGYRVISFPGVNKDSSAIVLSAIKRISATHLLCCCRIHLLVFVVPNGQFLPYVLLCLNSWGSKKIRACMCKSVCSWAQPHWLNWSAFPVPLRHYSNQHILRFLMHTWTSSHLSLYIFSAGPRSTLECLDPVFFPYMALICRSVLLYLIDSTQNMAQFREGANKGTAKGKVERRKDNVNLWFRVKGRDP